MSTSFLLKGSVEIGCTWSASSSVCLPHFAHSLPCLCIIVRFIACVGGFLAGLRKCSKALKVTLGNPSPRHGMPMSDVNSRIASPSWGTLLIVTSPPSTPIFNLRISRKIFIVSFGTKPLRR